jgi:ribosomal protein S18 acetylase RimI-like enzyme
MAVVLRPASPLDALDAARVHVRSWQSGYRGILPDDYLDAQRPEDRAARYTFADPDPSKPATIVALDDSVLCGFVTTGPAHERTAGAGHLMALYVDPARWGRGIGRALLDEGRRQLSMRGYREAVLWVLAGNHRAERCYQADGWSWDGREEQEEIWGICVTERRYRRALP